MHSLPETSESLIARVKNPADAVAWSEFLAIYRPVVYRMARRRMQDADAQDVTQKVLLSVSQAIDGWEAGPGQPPFRAWLSTIARNAILNALTRRRPDLGTGSSSLLEFLHNRADDGHETTAELLLESRRETLRQAAEQVRREFSPAVWALFWETAILGQPVAEVARACGKSVGAVYMARFKIMQRLKDHTKRSGIPTRLCGSNRQNRVAASSFSHQEINRGFRRDRGCWHFEGCSRAFVLIRALREIRGSSLSLIVTSLIHSRRLV